MKYGILFNKSNMNIGDDIQAYATERFLPRIDCFIDREHIDSFESENGEPVAVIMNAWYMWQKWNWPPSKYIYPLMTGFHYADHQLARQWYGTPLKYEFLEGIGGDYLNAYGPVGCRDMFTMNNLSRIGVNAFFSGCITMTLPRMPERDDKGSYVCLVDVAKKAREQLHGVLDGKIEVREISHLRERDETLPWDKRREIVEELLTIYQNARCVVTKRLHCALPCLAMGVPVLLVRGNEDDTRFEPYYDFLYHYSVDEIARGEYSYDFLNPPANREDFLPYREKLIARIREFVETASKETGTADELKKTTYTEQEVTQWRHDVMKKALELWFEDDHRKHEKEVEIKRELKEQKLKYKQRGEKINELKGKVSALKEKNNSYKEKLSARNEKISKLKNKNAALTEKLNTTEKELEQLRNESIFKTIRRKMRRNKSK